MARTHARERILAAAEELMLANGYAGTRVDEICARASVSKGSFYHFFASKEALAVATLDAFYLRVRDILMGGDFMLETDGVERAYAFLDHVERVGVSVWEHGSLPGGFAMEAAATGGVIGASLRSLMGEMVAVLGRIFEPFARPKVMSGEDLALHFLSILEGSVVVARARGDWAGFAPGIRRFRHYLELYGGD